MGCDSYYRDRFYRHLMEALQETHRCLEPDKVCLPKRWESLTRSMVRRGLISGPIAISEDDRNEIFEIGPRWLK